jgi:putative ABC transport system permease protein
MAHFSIVETFWRDVRYGLRTLGRSPGFAVAATLTLAIGISANTAIFSVVDAVLLKPLPFTEANRLVFIWESKVKDRAATSPISSADFVDWKDQAKAFEQFAAWRFLYFNLSGRDEPERVQGLTTSASFLSLLGAQLQAGRAFLAEEEQAGHDKVVILSDALWRRRFAGDRRLVGQRVDIEGQSYTVVGILAPSFQIFRVLNRPLDIFVPLTFDLRRLNRQDHDMFVYARLKAGVTLDQAQSEMDVLYRRLEQRYPQTNFGRGVRVISISESFNGDLRPALFLLFSAVACVLLIACSNVANMALGRASFRQREMAVRRALGAGRTSLVMQALTEHLLLALFGGVAGILIAFLGIHVLNDVIPYQAVKRLHEFVIDTRVLGFTVIVSLLSAVVSGIAPALRFNTLGDFGQSGGRRSTENQRALRLAGSLVVSEVALAVALSCCAVLLVRSSLLVQGMPRGINPDNVLTTQIWLPRAKYSQAHQVVNFYREVLQRMEKLSGVESASVINFPPLALQYTAVNFTIVGESVTPSLPEEALNARCSVIGEDYFRTMNIPLLSGRTFTDHDSDEAHGVVIISASMARRFWPNVDPIGRQIRPQFSQQKYFWIPESKNLPLTIVGVVGDVRYDGLANANLPQMYLPYLQNPSSIMNLVVRTTSAPLRWTNTVRNEVWAVDKDQPLFDTKTIEDVVADSFGRARSLASLLGSFSVMALLLAALGTYGLISYAVSKRTREIGIRMALGAQSADVLSLIVRQGMGLTLLGVAIGLFAGLATARFLGSFLYGVKPTDPVSFIGVALLLTGTAALACYIPARRAMRVDPIVALRHD